MHYLETSKMIKNKEPIKIIMNTGGIFATSNYSHSFHYKIIPPWEILVTALAAIYCSIQKSLKSFSLEPII